MSNRELLDRCLDAFNFATPVYYQNEDQYIEWYAKYNKLMFDIRAERSKPSQSETEDFSKAYGLLAVENEQLKSKLAEAEKDAKRYQAIKQHITFDLSHANTKFWCEFGPFDVNGFVDENQMEKSLDIAISNNTKELG